MYNKISFTYYSKNYSILHVNDTLHFRLSNDKRKFLEDSICCGDLEEADLVAELEKREKNKLKKIGGLQDYQLKIELLSAKLMNRIVVPFEFLFKPFVMFICSLLSIGVCIYGLFCIGSSCPNDTMSLAMFIFVFGGMCIFHEFGHSSACKYFHAPINGIGFGIAGYRPVMFSDVTGAWYLRLKQRLIVNMAGIYFQLLYISVLFGAGMSFKNSFCVETGYVLLFSVIFQFLPFFRTDGYWLLSDIVNEPNLYEKSHNIVRQLFLGKSLSRVEKKCAIYFLITEVVTIFSLAYYLWVNFSFFIGVPLALLHLLQELSIGDFHSLYYMQIRYVWNILFLYIILKKIIEFLKINCCAHFTKGVVG